eukprot:10317464-Ditylum_brightwellii.AAC.1
MRGVFVLLSEDISKVEITNHMMDSNKMGMASGRRFDLSLSGIDFGFTGTAGCDGLMMALPVDGTVEPKKET